MKTMKMEILAALLVLAGLAERTAAQSSAFTYQGRLSDNGALANGTYDLSFGLYTVPSGGTPLAPNNFVNDLAISNGVFIVVLNFGATVFDGSDRWLQIAVRPGGTTNAYANLTPRQPLTAAPYAIRAATFSGTVAASQLTGTISASNIGVGTISSSMIATGAVGSAQLAANAVTSSKIAAGAVTTSKIATGAVTTLNLASNSVTAAQIAPGAAVANLNAQGQSGVPQGGVVISKNANDTNLLNAGYKEIGKLQLPDVWEQRAGSASWGPKARAVWTGAEMIVWWGVGYSPGSFAGARYNPAANTWTEVATAGAPTAVDSQYQTTVWTGTEMIVWGSFKGGDYSGRYNPVLNSWAPVSMLGAPAQRYHHTAVWTGTEMIIWGGFEGGSMTAAFWNNGGRYNPVDNTWKAVSTTGAPAGRAQHTAVWTGSEMIIWGGFLNDHTVNQGYYLNTGGRYNPAANSWTAVSTAGVPNGRTEHTAVWTGSEMIIWGGFNEDNFFGYLNTGGRYNPSANSWSAVSTIGAPGTRSNHSAVWTGDEMIVWGGAYVKEGEGTHYFGDGGRYSPLADSWTPVTTYHAPYGRRYHATVWTGSEMIIWGGEGAGQVLNEAFSYNPRPTLHLYQRQ